jgi:hypothetical protein
MVRIIACLCLGVSLLAGVQGADLETIAISMGADTGEYPLATLPDTVDRFFDERLYDMFAQVTDRDLAEVVARCAIAVRDDPLYRAEALATLDDATEQEYQRVRFRRHRTNLGLRPELFIPGHEELLAFILIRDQAGENVVNTKGWYVDGQIIEAFQHNGRDDLEPLVAAHVAFLAGSGRTVLASLSTARFLVGCWVDFLIAVDDVPSAIRNWRVLLTMQAGLRRNFAGRLPEEDNGTWFEYDIPQMLARAMLRRRAVWTQALTEIAATTDEACARTTLGILIQQPDGAMAPVQVTLPPMLPHPIE